MQYQYTNTMYWQDHTTTPISTIHNEKLKHSKHVLRNLQRSVLILGATYNSAISICHVTKNVTIISGPLMELTPKLLVGWNVTFYQIYMQWNVTSDPIYLSRGDTRFNQDNHIHNHIIMNSTEIVQSTNMFMACNVRRSSFHQIDSHSLFTYMHSYNEAIIQHI